MDVSTSPELLLGHSVPQAEAPCVVLDSWMYGVHGGKDPVLLSSCHSGSSLYLQRSCNLITNGGGLLSEGCTVVFFYVWRFYLVVNRSFMTSEFIPSKFTQSNKYIYYSGFIYQICSVSVPMTALTVSQFQFRVCFGPCLWINTLPSA